MVDDVGFLASIFDLTRCTLAPSSGFIFFPLQMNFTFKVFFTEMKLNHTIFGGGENITAIILLSFSNVI